MVISFHNDLTFCRLIIEKIRSVIDNVTAHINVFFFFFFYKLHCSCELIYVLIVYRSTTVTPPVRPVYK